jgi:chromosome segregation ATPase
LFFIARFPRQTSFHFWRQIFTFGPSFLENLDRAEKRAEELAAKLKRSEKAREKAEQEAATVEDLRQRLHKAENALSDKVSQQIARENAIIARLETQNRQFVSKFLLLSSKIPVGLVLCVF